MCKRWSLRTCWLTRQRIGLLLLVREIYHAVCVSQRFLVSKAAACHLLCNGTAVGKVRFTRPSFHENTPRAFQPAFLKQLFTISPQTVGTAVTQSRASGVCLDLTFHILVLFEPSGLLLSIGFFEKEMHFYTIICLSEWCDSFAWNVAL